MNRLVRDHYPVERLPEDLREGFGPNQDVRVTVEPTSPLVDAPELDFVSLVERPGRILSLEQIFSMRRPVFNSVEDVLAHVRSIRDEAE